MNAMTHPAWCIEHAPLDPAVHIGYVAAAGISIAIEQQPDEPAYLLIELTNDDGYTADGARRLSLAITQAANALEHGQAPTTR